MVLSRKKLTVFFCTFILFMFVFGCSAVYAASDKTIYLDDGGWQYPSGWSEQPVGQWDGNTKTATLTRNVAGWRIRISAGGITLDGSGYSLDGNGKLDYGVYAYDKRGIIIKNLTVKGYDKGIYFDQNNGDKEGNTVKDCIIENNKTGIYLNFSNKNTFEGNTIRSSSDNGIFLFESDSNLTSDNTFDGNKYAMYFSTFSNSNTIYNNNFLNSSKKDIELKTSSLDNSFCKSGPDYGNYWDKHTGVNDDNDDGILDRGYLIYDRILADDIYDSSPWAAANGWKDKTPPETAALLSGVQGGSGWYRSSVEVAFTAVDNQGGTGVKKTMYSLDSSSFSMVPASGNITVNDEGMHTVRFFSIDRSGNRETEKSVSFGIDVTKPDAAADPAGGIYYRPRYVTLTAQGGDTEIYYTLNGDEPTAGVNKYTTPILIDHNTILKFMAVDTAGNRSDTYTEEYSIELPRITGLRLSMAQASPLRLRVDIETNTAENLLYQIWSEDKDGWALVKPYSDELTGETYFIWEPAEKTDNDSYKVHVRIKGSDTQVIYDQKTEMATCVDMNIVRMDKVTVRTLDTVTNIDITTDPAIKVHGEKGVPVTLTAFGSGAGNLEYMFRISDGNGWTDLRGYSAESTFEWIPEKAGNFVLLAGVKGGEPDNIQYHELTVRFDITDSSYAYAELADVEVSQGGEGTVNITALSVPGNDNLLYRFSAGESYYTIVQSQDYSPSNTFSWSADKSGFYQITTYVKDGQSKQFEDGMRKYYRVVKPEVGTVSLDSVDLSHPEGEYPVGTEITFTAHATGGNELLYAFLREEASGVRLIKDYSDNSFSWIPARPGVYKILVRVRDTRSGSYEDCKEFTYRITDPGTAGITINSLDISGNFHKRTNHVLAADASAPVPCGENLMYKFIVDDDLYGLQVLQQFSPYNTCNWLPRKAGTYRVIVWVKGASSGSFEQKLVREVTIQD